MASTTMIVRGIGIVAMIVLARLLDPADFGAVALAMVLFSTARLFSGLGMGSALIHNERPVKETAFPAFAVTVLFSTALFLALNVSIDVFARLLGNTDIIPLLRWLSLLLLFTSWLLVPEALLRKELRFGQISRSLIARDLVSYSISIGLAFAGYGIWSLVWGRLIGSLVRMLWIWWAAPGWQWMRPQRFEREVLNELIPYGIKATSSGIVNFANSSWDDWFVGRVFGIAALGFYDKAYALTNDLIISFNQAVLGGVFMPSYVKLRDNYARLANAYLKALGLSALVMAPMAMGIFSVADELVYLLLGEKWMPMVPALRIFAFMALARPLAASTSPLFRAVGHPEYDLRGGLVVLGAMVPMVFGLSRWGIEGVALAVTLSFVCGLIYNVYLLNGLMPGTAIRLFPRVWPALLASALMIGSVAITRTLLLQSALADMLWLVLTIEIAAGALVYLMAAYVFQRDLVHEMVRLLLSVLRKRPAAKSAQQTAQA